MGKEWPDLSGKESNVDPGHHYDNIQEPYLTRVPVSETVREPLQLLKQQGLQMLSASDLFTKF